jgi:hypothetical protein
VDVAALKEEAAGWVNPGGSCWVDLPRRKLMVESTQEQADGWINPGASYLADQPRST